MYVPPQYASLMQMPITYIIYKVEEGKVRERVGTQFAKNRTDAVEKYRAQHPEHKESSLYAEF